MTKRESTPPSEWESLTRTPVSNVESLDKQLPSKRRSNDSLLDHHALGHFKVKGRSLTAKGAIGKLRIGPTEISVERLSALYVATYSMEGGVLTVRSRWGDKSARGGADHAFIARSLLRDLLEAAEARGEL